MNTKWVATIWSKNFYELRNGAVTQANDATTSLRNSSFYATGDDAI